jgi:CheY-like chemotaxis protein
MDIFRSCRFTRHLTNGCVHARYEWYGGYCYYPATGWRCRQSPYYCDTAHALAGYEAMCLAASMNGYATKPISQKNLLALVDTWATNKDYRLC